MNVDRAKLNEIHKLAHFITLNPAGREEDRRHGAEIKELVTKIFNESEPSVELRGQKIRVSIAGSDYHAIIQ